MNKNEIKKALYRQKPTATLTDYKGDYKHYVTQLEDKSIIEFHVPISDMGDAEFGSTMESHLLIRYLVE